MTRKALLTEAKYSSCYSIEHDQEKELQCPACGCEKINFISNDEAVTAGHLYLGLRATCYECKHEFTITENCWKVVKTFEND